MTSVLKIALNPEKAQVAATELRAILLLEPVEPKDRADKMLAGLTAVLMRAFSETLSKGLAETVAPETAAVMMVKVAEALEAMDACAEIERVSKAIDFVGRNRTH